MKLGLQEAGKSGKLHKKAVISNSKKENPTRIVIVPVHKEVARGTLKNILEQARISLEEVLELL
jgi:hypothetical protein